MLAALERIARAVRVPVTADIEAGFGASTEELQRTVAGVVRAGAVGINLEDGLNGHAVLRDPADAAGRIAAARAAGEDLGVPIVINARIDVFLRGGGTAASRMAEAVDRARAYLASGADCVYPIGLSSPPDIAAFVAAVAAPVNVWAKPGMPDAATLRALGVARISTATALALRAAAGLQQLAADLRAHGRFDELASPLSHADLQRLMKRE
jgi:2-methylisocitrate lyase-like PEP mutase family enzyme